jgi:hypothetical protein
MNSGTFSPGTAMTEKMIFLLKARDGYNNACRDLENLIQYKLADIKHLSTIKIMIRKFKSKLEKIDKEIESIRKNCSHKFEYKGHGHNYDFYDCTECGQSEER